MNLLYIVFHLSQSWFCPHAWYLQTQQLKVTYLSIHPLYCIYRVITTKVAYLYIHLYTWWNVCSWIQQMTTNKKNNLLLGFVKLLLYFCTEFPEFRHENTLCVAGCYHCDIVVNSQCQNCSEFALCVSRH